MTARYLAVASEVTARYLAVTSEPGPAPRWERQTQAPGLDAAFAVKLLAHLHLPLTGNVLELLLGDEITLLRGIPLRLFLGSLHLLLLGILLLLIRGHLALDLLNRLLFVLLGDP